MDTNMSRIEQFLYSALYGGDPGIEPQSRVEELLSQFDFAGKQDVLIESGATAGQFVKISSVDEDGKPTGYEPADVESGSIVESGGHIAGEVVVVGEVDSEGKPTAYTADSISSVDFRFPGYGEGTAFSEGDLVQVNNLDANGRPILFSPISIDTLANNIADYLRSDQFPTLDLTDYKISGPSTQGPPTEEIYPLAVFVMGIPCGARIKFLLDGSAYGLGTDMTIIAPITGMTYWAHCPLTVINLDALVAACDFTVLDMHINFVFVVPINTESSTLHNSIIYTTTSGDPS